MKVHRRRPHPEQLTFEQARRPTGRGGWRPGAGRPRGRTKVAHERRPAFAARYPQHITLRIVPGVASLRRFGSLRVVRRAIAAAHRDAFRVVHFNLLSNHLHLIVEAHNAQALARGMQGLAVRLARGLNKALGRSGRLFMERYHARSLKSPREVRFALRYVLLNDHHHAAAHGERRAWWADAYSSGIWFDGWRHPLRAHEPWQRQLLATPRPTALPTVWLLTTGWKRGGSLWFDDRPGDARRPR